MGHSRGVKNWPCSGTGWLTPNRSADRVQRKGQAVTATTTAAVVPHVTSADPGVAYARLHRAGLRVRFDRSFSAGSLFCLPTIAQQSPRAGRRVRRGGVVTLRAQPPRCGAASPAVPTGQLPAAKVPAFAGRPVSAAVAWAERHRLYWEVDRLPPLTAGTASGLLGNYRVSRQRPRAGTVLMLGIATGGGNQGSFQSTPLTLQGKLEESTDRSRWHRAWP